MRRRRRRGRSRRRGRGDQGTGRVLEAPKGNVVLGNWQAPKAQLSTVWEGLHMYVLQPCL